MMISCSLTQTINMPQNLCEFNSSIKTILVANFLELLKQKKPQYFCTRAASSWAGIAQNRIYSTEELKYA